MYYFALLILLFTWIVGYWVMRRAAAGKVPYVRHIAAFEAIDEAIGRASEMGRPVHLTTGHSGAGLYSKLASDHLAGLSMLNYVAKKCAESATDVIATVAFSEMIPVAEDIIRFASIGVGKPEFYRDDMVRFASDNWLGYDMYAMRMASEAAANIMIGAMDSTSSAIIACGGAIAGAMNIGGARAAGDICQLVPFCDYVLIGEETPAAGAIVSGDTDSLASSVSTDYTKALIVVIILLGIMMASIGLSMDWVSM